MPRTSSSLSVELLKDGDNLNSGSLARRSQSARAASRRRRRRRRSSSASLASGSSSDSTALTALHPLTRPCLRPVADRKSFRFWRNTERGEVALQIGCLSAEIADFSRQKLAEYLGSMALLQKSKSDLVRHPVFDPFLQIQVIPAETDEFISAQTEGVPS